jgi:hypothetical protein
MRSLLAIMLLVCLGCGDDGHRPPITSADNVRFRLWTWDDVCSDLHIDSDELCCALNADSQKINLYRHDFFRQRSHTEGLTVVEPLFRADEVERLRKIITGNDWKLRRLQRRVEELEKQVGAKR